MMSSGSVPKSWQLIGVLSASMGHSPEQRLISHAFVDRDHFVGNLGGQEGVGWVVMVTAGLFPSC